MHAYFKRLKHNRYGTTGNSVIAMFSSNKKIIEIGLYDIPRTFVPIDTVNEECKASRVSSQNQSMSSEVEES